MRRVLQLGSAKTLTIDTPIGTPPNAVFVLYNQLRMSPVISFQ
jgi:hypothetical protein